MKRSLKEMRALLDAAENGHYSYVIASERRDAFIAAAPEIVAELLDTVEVLGDALSRSRGQWIHSVNADRCLEALSKLDDEEGEAP